MKKKSLIVLVALVSLYLSGWSQQYQRTGLGIKTTIDSIDVEIQFYSPEIVRILKSPTGISYERKVFQ